MSKTTLKQSFTVRDAATLAALKPAMVDYLCRSDLLVPTTRKKPGRGKPRRYTFGDIVILRALSHLLGCGISVAKLKTSLRTLRRYHPEITPESLPARYLVTDGTRVIFKTEHNVLEDLTAGGQLAFAFVVELQQVRDEISQKARALKWIA